MRQRHAYFERCQHGNVPIRSKPRMTRCPLTHADLTEVDFLANQHLHASTRRGIGIFGRKGSIALLCTISLSTVSRQPKHKLQHHINTLSSYQHQPKQGVKQLTCSVAAKSNSTDMAAPPPPPRAVPHKRTRSDLTINRLRTRSLSLPLLVSVRLAPQVLPPLRWWRFNRVFIQGIRPRCIETCIEPIHVVERCKALCRNHFCRRLWRS